MREKWRLCVISVGILACSVLGALVLLNYTMSSADDRTREFSVTQAVSESSVSGQVVSGGSVSGSSVSEQEVSGEQPSFYGYGQVNPADPLGTQIVSCAMGWQGVRYVYGGTDLPDQASAWTDGNVKEKGFEGKDLWGKCYGVDCSGFVMRVYERFGIKLPRSVKDQAEMGREVKLKDIEPGDIIFYGANNTTLTHCGIYAGDGQIIHVSAQTKVVTFDDMNYRRIAKVKRVVS